MSTSLLLYMPLKVPPRYDLVQPLANWLDNSQDDDHYENNHNGGHYHHHHHSDNNDDAPPTPALLWLIPKPTFTSVECRSELLRLAALRNCLSEHLLDSHKAALAQRALQDCQEYHATLLEFEKRGFPTSENNDSIALVWRGAFATKQLETHHSLVWERCGCLWNVAALQSFEGATQQDWTSAEGCKTAISLFQSSASLLATLQELVEPFQEDYSTVDYSKGMLQFWQTLCKAQAQYCIYKLANLGSGDQQRSHSTLAFLVQAAAALFNDSLVLAQDPRLQSEVPKPSQTWATQCKAQSLTSQARATFHMSIEHRLQKQHGLELARLAECLSQLKESFEFYKSASLDLTEIQTLLKLAKDRFERARTDNDTIYLDDVPLQLPEIRAQIMVKSTVPLAAAMLQTQVTLFQWYDTTKK